MSKLVDATGSPAEEKTPLAEINEAQAEVLFRKVETKAELEAQNAAASKKMVAFSKLYEYATGGEKCMLYTGWLLAGLSGCLLPCMFFFLGPVFDTFTEETEPKEMARKIREICLIIAGIAVVIFISGFFQNWLLMRASTSIASKIKTKYLRAVLNQESAWYDQTNYMELSSRIAKETDAIQNGIGRKYGNIVYSYCMCFSGFATGLYKGWSLALAMLGIAPIMLIGMGIFGHVMANRTLASTKAYGQSAGYAEQALAAIRIVVSFGQEDLEIKNYTTYLQKVKEAGHKAAFTSGLSMGFFMFCIYLCYAYAFLIGAYWMDKPYWNHAEDRDYMSGDVIGVFFGVLIGLFSLGGTAPAINSVNAAKTTGSLVFGIIDRKVPIQQDDKSAAMHDLKGEIEFRNVQFYYPSRPDTPVMQDFSHKFALGKTTAIVGPSGSGKSTTIQLVERFYDPQQGDIYIDGQNLKEINLRNYRQQIGYVGQEPVMFNMSIKENILMGKPGASDKEIQEALEAVNAWDFVSKYPNQMNENVGAGGGQLSGGQKQRIALARAFIKKPKMLIFDEATSALDKANEAIVVQAIDALKARLGAVTTLVIAHRLSSVRSADNIIVMKKGRIVEQGSHDELVKISGGVYAKLNAQDEAASKKDAEKQAIAAEATKIDEQLVAQIDPRLVAGAKATKSGARRLSAMPTVDVTETKEVDPVAKAKMREAQLQLKAASNMLKWELDDLINPKKQEAAFRKIMGHYAKPGWMIMIGIIMTAIFGIISPMYGWFIMETMNGLNEGYTDRLLKQRGDPLYPPSSDDTVFERAFFWCIIMIIGSCAIFVSKSIGQVFLSKVSENITSSVRRDLYASIIHKDIGWHDHRENSSGIMTGTLASDVQLLNGVSSEGMGAQIEGTVAALTGTVMAFIFSWPLALCTLGILPIFLICGVIEQKADQENMMDMAAAEGSEDMELSDDVKMSKLLCSDAITNYKTVASFGNDQVLIEQFQAINDRAAETEDKKAKWYAISLSLSIAINNGSFALLYIAMGELYAEWPTYEYTQYDKMMLATFSFIFGAFAAAQAISMGPDVKKATAAAMKIFQIMRTPSKIDTDKSGEYQVKTFVKYEVHGPGKQEGEPKLDDDGNRIIVSGGADDLSEVQWIEGVQYETKEARNVDAQEFKGQIEFKDVWFRYPTKLQQWVFKGLNLKINQKDNIAIVGESGQGKSTFIGLVMRFYDPEFGQVLIDGVDVREMDVRQLRQRLGLVQQEPLLFNYTLKENILYGRLNASNSDILDAAKQANALEFITAGAGEVDLSQSFGDDPVELLEAWIAHKEKMYLELDKSLTKKAMAKKTEYQSKEKLDMGEGSKEQKEQQAQDETTIAYLTLDREDKQKVVTEKYEEYKKSIESLVQKDATQGKFEEVVDLVDTRTDPSLLEPKLDPGFNVFAGNRGSKLSGGQKQRIAIARAIIRQPGILLLDEATSALDEESQRLVQEALYAIMGDRTSIVVAHRLTTVEKCNRLAVIDEGVIVEEGTFSDLLSKDGGRFSNLANGMQKIQKKADKRASVRV